MNSKNRMLGLEIMIRKLRSEDAERMMSWMHDKEIVKNFRKNFMNYTIQDAKEFIKGSFTDQNQNFALVDEVDTYIGTISLKNISYYNKNAEINSVFCRTAKEEEIKNGLDEVINYAFTVLGLQELYIHIYEDNDELIRFYSDFGFEKGGTFVNPLYIQKRPRKLCWYYKRLNDEERTENHKLLLFQEKGDLRGHMVVIEQFKDVPFAIKRLFYMYGSEGDSIRGKHANRKSEFVLINVSGKSKVKIFDGKSEHIYELTQPHMGIYIPNMVWKEMYDFSEDSVLLVLASELYDANEYIRDKNQYIRELQYGRR